MTKEILTEAEAAKLLNVKPKTLQNWRYAKTGPKFYQPKFRVIRYFYKDIMEFIKGEKHNDV